MFSSLRFTWVKVMVKMACERLLTSFMPVLATVRLASPRRIRPSTSPWLWTTCLDKSARSLPLHFFPDLKYQNNIDFLLYFQHRVHFGDVPSLSNPQQWSVRVSSWEGPELARCRSPDSCGNKKSDKEEEKKIQTFMILPRFFILYSSQKLLFWESFIKQLNCIYCTKSE